MDCRSLRRAACVETRASYGLFVIAPAMLAIAALLVVSLPQASYADDFVADAQCVEGHWYVTIYDASLRGSAADAGDGEDLRAVGLLSGVSIRTIAAAGSSDVKSTFETDENGKFFLAPEYNTGWVWLSKPGYNDQKIRSTCDTAYDAFSYSEQFASYCYDYAYAAIPMTYLPAVSKEDQHGGSVESIMDFFDGQIAHRDGVIAQQAWEIRELFGALERANATGSNATDAVVKMSNSTRDMICLSHVGDANTLMYEMFGLMHVFRSGFLEADALQDALDLWRDDAMERVSGIGENTYCSNAGATPEMAEKIESELGIMLALYAELERQTAELEYELHMMSLSRTTPQSAPSHYPHPYTPPPLQSYYYYNNNYYADHSHYAGDDGMRDFYYYDATGTKPYDYGNHNTNKRYNPADHGDHDHGHGDCVTFCDKDDYEPDWARYLDRHGAREACWDVEAEPDRIGTADWYWCKDLEKFLYIH